MWFLSALRKGERRVYLCFQESGFRQRFSTSAPLTVWAQSAVLRALPQAEWDVERRLPNTFTPNASCAPTSCGSQQCGQCPGANCPGPGTKGVDLVARTPFG